MTEHKNWYSNDKSFVNESALDFKFGQNENITEFDGKYSIIISLNVPNRTMNEYSLHFVK